jgi:recombinational DNA repair protein (RecF pathway)
MLQRAVLNTGSRVAKAASAAPTFTDNGQLFSGLSQASIDVINRLAEEKQNSVSLSQLYNFGLQASDDTAAAEAVLIQAAQYLHTELPKR